MKNVYQKLMLLALLAVHATPLVAGDENVTPIKKYLDASTAFVAWIDVNQTDFDGLQEFAAEYDISVGSMSEAKNLQKVLKTVKVPRVYVVGSLQQITSGTPLFVLPCTPENIDSVEIASSTTLNTKPFVVAKDGNNVLIGSEAVVARYSGMQASSTPTKLLASIANAEYPSAAILHMPAASSILLSPLVPDLISGLKASSDEATIISQGIMSLQTASLSSSSPPTAGSLHITLSNNDHTEALANTLNEMIRRNAPETADGFQLKADGNAISHISTNADQISATMKCVAQLLLPARASAARNRDLNSLKQIAIGMHNFHDVWGRFPPQSLSSADGQKLLSWRVLILPYLGEQELYKKFRLDEPWDSEHNIKLAAEIPFVYSGVIPGQGESDGKTRIQAPLHKQSVFGRKGDGTTIRQITDGTSNTLMVVQVPQTKAVVWTKPDDIVVDVTDVKASLIAPGIDAFLACLCDGSARACSSKNSNETLLKLITMDGGEVVGKLQ